MRLHPKEGVMKRWVTIPAAVLAFISSSHADLVRGSQTVFVNGGFGYSSSQYDFNPGEHRDVTGSGPAFGSQYMYYLSSIPALAIGADLTYAYNGKRRSDDLLAGYETTSRLKSLVGLVVAKLAFPRGELRPYVFAGLGAHHSSQQVSAQPQGLSQWAGGGNESRILIDKQKTSAAIAYGIGLDLFPADSFFIGTELRGVWLAGLDTNDNAALRAAGFVADEKQPITQAYVLMHLGWKF
jgi:opacity protein-like surface antigen